MERKAVSGIMLTLLLTSMLTLTFNIQPVKAGGTIYIRANGNIDPPTAPIQRDGDVYTFTDDIYETVEVQKDNVTVDGNGFTLQGGTDYGFFLPERSNVTIKNTRIVGFSTGILLFSSSGNTVSNNTIISNQWFGISIQGGSVIQLSSNNMIVNNTVTDIVCGIQFHGGGELHNTIVGNNVNSNVIGIQLSENARYNTFRDNTISNNDYGLIIMYRPENEENYGNRVFHNNFIDNTCQAVDNGTSNVLDDGYPSAGNYWSDHVTVDEYSDVYQNETGSDGIVDEPYIIDENNQDVYPLTEPWAEPAMIKSLIRTIKFWDLPKGTQNSLKAKLKVAIHMLDMGKEDGAIRKLTGFINRVEMLRERTLTDDQADCLIAEAQRIINLIEG